MNDTTAHSYLEYNKKIIKIVLNSIQLQNFQILCIIFSCMLSDMVTID